MVSGPGFPFLASALRGFPCMMDVHPAMRIVTAFARSQGRSTGAF